MLFGLIVHAYYAVAMSRTTIAVQTETRARLKAAAESRSTTIDGVLRLLLDEHERAQFWASIENLNPQAYAAALSADGDDLDQDYRAEDAALEAELQ